MSSWCKTDNNIIHRPRDSISSGQVIIAVEGTPACRPAGNCRRIDRWRTYQSASCVGQQVSGPGGPGQLGQAKWSKAKQMTARWTGRVSMLWLAVDSAAAKVFRAAMWWDSMGYRIGTTRLHRKLCSWGLEHGAWSTSERRRKRQVKGPRRRQWWRHWLEAHCCNRLTVGV